MRVSVLGGVCLIHIVIASLAILHLSLAVPGFAIKLREENQHTLYIHENGSSALVCLVKISGNITSSDGLRVALLFTFPESFNGAIIDLDYTVTSGGGVHFRSGAEDGEENCISVTSICDNNEEGNETITVLLQSTDEYQAQTIGAQFSGFINIIIVETTDCTTPQLRPPPPTNVRIRNMGSNSPTVTVEWNIPMLNGAFTYRVTIDLIGYSEEEDNTMHTITADGVNLLLNTPYTVEVATINGQGEESSPTFIGIEIVANAPPTPYIDVTVECLQAQISWMYGVPSDGVYTPVVDTTLVTYTAQSSGNSGKACSYPGMSSTGCTFSIPQQDTYHFILTVTNSVGSNSTTSLVTAFLTLPHPPITLRNISKGLSSITIAWQQPADNMKYRVRVVGTSYYEEISCAEVECTHTITADGNIVLFNTSYTVKVQSVDICGLESNPQNISIYIDSEKDDISDNSKETSTPTWVWILIAVIITSLFIVLGAIVAIYLRYRCKRNSHRDEHTMVRFSSSAASAQKRSPTGPIYAELEIPTENRGKMKNEHIYQDPDSIDHLAAESGDLYAMPRKKKKNGQEGESNLYDDTIPVTPRKHPFGLQYAELNFPHKTTKAPPKKPDSAYVQIQYKQ